MFGQSAQSAPDTGMGMSRAECARVFEPYQQARTDTARQFGGTGLGLAISQRLMQLMGGTIEVQSVQGQGSTFRLSFRIPAPPL